MVDQTKKNQHKDSLIQLRAFEKKIWKQLKEDQKARVEELEEYENIRREEGKSQTEVQPEFHISCQLMATTSQYRIMQFVSYKEVWDPLQK